VDLRIRTSDLLKRTRGSAIYVTCSSGSLIHIFHLYPRPTRVCIWIIVSGATNVPSKLSTPRLRSNPVASISDSSSQEFEMVLPGSIDSYMSRRASRPKRADGWFYFPEFKAVVEGYTRVKYDPEALKVFTRAQMQAVRESLEFRAQRRRWMAGKDAKDRVLRSRRNEREAEFLAVFRQHLPKHSERNPLQPPDEVVLREVAGLDDFLMERDGEIPVTSERMKGISGSLVTHCEAFNRKIRRMMVVISKRFPIDRSFTMTDDECYEYLGRATTIFLTDTRWGQEWHTYQSFTFKMRQVKDKKVLFGMVDDFYVNEDYSDRVGALLECMGLPKTATLGAAVAKQTKSKVYLSMQEHRLQTARIIH
jgi:hypothetical protein